MTHPREEWLALAATGDLPWWLAAWVRRHTARCSGCAARAAEYGSLAGELAGLPVPEPPPSLVAAVLARAPAPVVAFPFSWRARSLAAVAAVLLVALLLLPGRGPVPSERSQPAATGGVALPVAPAVVLATASASPEAVVGETAGPRGRHRLVLYSSAKGSSVELSAGAGTALASRSDPRTGALLITRLGIEGLP